MNYSATKIPEKSIRGGAAMIPGDLFFLSPISRSGIEGRGDPDPTENKKWRVLLCEYLQLPPNATEKRINSELTKFFEWHFGTPLKNPPDPHKTHPVTGEGREAWASKSDKQGLATLSATGIVTLSADESQVMNNLGISPDKWEKHNGTRITTLSASDDAIRRAMGISEEAWLKHN
jgi:hypothetical protein